LIKGMRRKNKWLRTVIEIEIEEETQGIRSSGEEKEESVPFVLKTPTSWIIKT